MQRVNRRRLIAGGLGVLGTGALAACSREAQPEAPAQAQAPASSPALSHIHAVVRDPDDPSVVLLAAHEGLFRLSERRPTAVGPEIDLMGFTVTPEGRYLASGHPGPGVDLPEPLGLIESTDRGESWNVISRGGESDFHALASTSDRVLGFDGELRVSEDGQRWTTLPIESAPASVAIAEGSGVMLAATEEGVLRSEDGSTWDRLDTPQLIQFLSWVDAQTIVGVSVAGHVLISHDAGDNWTVSQESVGEVSALGAGLTGEGDVELLLVVGVTVLRTLDGGETTERLL
ncbi:F510_1955 family glycosylhydrolase [Nesterenkonia sp. CF4.4]|uniref:F510_1955 family glycosylhydrolase n=1 Tax=Nesterenkonia sp. CF4.4 TaxID=3373079 RepID=UPI003EE756F6